MSTTTEQAVKIGNHFIGLARFVAGRFDLSQKAVVEAAIAEYHAKYCAAPMLTISRVAESPALAPLPVAPATAAPYKIGTKKGPKT
jgi:hypothetical protein